LAFAPTPAPAAVKWTSISARIARVRRASSGLHTHVSDVTSNITTHPSRFGGHLGRPRPGCDSRCVAVGTQEYKDLEQRPTIHKTQNTKGSRSNSHISDDVGRDRSVLVSSTYDVDEKMQSRDDINNNFYRSAPRTPVSEEYLLRGATSTKIMLRSPRPTLHYTTCSLSLVLLPAQHLLVCHTLAAACPPRPPPDSPSWHQSS
jgi:hypothetical protein